MKYIIDLDGVLAEFNRPFAKMIDGRDVLDYTSWPVKWDWPEEYTTTYKLALAWEKVRSSASFWETLPSFPWTREVLELLYHEEVMGHEVYFVTVRLGHDIKRQTERWLSNHGFKHPTVLVSTHGDKSGIVHDLDADVMIDDKPEFLLRAREKGKDRLRLYIQVHPYNKDFAMHDAIKLNILPIESPVTAVKSEYARRELYREAV